jgi:hypothetical protein
MEETAPHSRLPQPINGIASRMDMNHCCVRRGNMNEGTNVKESMMYTTLYPVGKGYEVVNAISLWSHSELFVLYFIDEFQFTQSIVLLIFRCFTFPMHVTYFVNLIFYLV